MDKNILKHNFQFFYHLYKYFKRGRIICNLFKTSHPKRVLISYVTAPFASGINVKHTNNLVSVVMAEAFGELGYQVDVCDYDYNGRIDYARYDLIFGFGDVLCNSFYCRPRSIKTIYYGTGMHIRHQNYHTLRRVRDVYNKTGRWIPESGRIVEKSWAIQTALVDAMVLLGNSFVAESYRKYYSGPIYSVSPSYNEVIPFDECLQMLESKNYEKTKQNFLWFGSTGLIHKGLDLLLEAFEKEQGFNLHVCGPINNEERFKELYFNKLYRLPNVHVHGFVDLRSDLFRELMGECAFVVSPSCSEAGPTAVYNCMANGLIPVVTAHNSIDVGDFGCGIESFTEQDVVAAIRFAGSLSSPIVKERALKTFEFIRKNNNINKFKSDFKGILERIQI